ncbi:PR domain zinc finger protein 13 [Papilio machaon]|uniref:PR domain zinc finger protein 13 n=1 Tax=Papilio machaon TaxID=76193 RepID=A0A194REN6_PAPMA|nr:PR domain zinc finger protein 13 [Papilio machaon]
MRTLARRGLPSGACSAAFGTRELRLALQHALFTPHNVYVDLDVSGRLCARGGPAGAAVCANLAPASPAATLLLCATSHSAPQQLGSAPETTEAGCLRLRLQAEAAPLQELQIWFDDTTLALLDMPFLSLKNIQGKKNYVCHDCGVEFEQPNPLKIHLFLKCGEYSIGAFWQTCLEVLERATSQRSSAFRPYNISSVQHSVSPMPHWPLLPLPADDAASAAVEALAAAWGKSRGGHTCLYCGKLYSRKYGLKIHIRTHTGYKPLRCRHCLRAFGDPSNLNKHVRLHAARAPHASQDSAPHACPRCGKPLARRRDLERHMRARHSHSPHISTTSPDHSS